MTQFFVKLKSKVKKPEAYYELWQIFVNKYFFENI